MRLDFSAIFVICNVYEFPVFIKVFPFTMPVVMYLDC